MLSMIPSMSRVFVVEFYCEWLKPIFAEHRRANIIGKGNMTLSGSPNIHVFLHGNFGWTFGSSVSIDDVMVNISLMALLNDGHEADDVYEVSFAEDSLIDEIAAIDTSIYILGLDGSDFDFAQ